MEFIMVVCIVATVTFGIYKIIELFARRRERLMIIDKLGERFKAEDIKNALELPLFSRSKSFSFPTLRASLLMMGIGIGLIASFLFQYNYLDLLNNNNADWLVDDNIIGLKFMLNFSGIAIFGGLGLLIAYLIETRKDKS